MPESWRAKGPRAGARVPGPSVRRILQAVACVAAERGRRRRASLEQLKQVPERRHPHKRPDPAAASLSCNVRREVAACCTLSVGGTSNGAWASAHPHRLSETCVPAATRAIR